MSNLPLDLILPNEEILLLFVLIDKFPDISKFPDAFKFPLESIINLLVLTVILLLTSILPAEITLPFCEFAINLSLLTVKLFKTLMSFEDFIFPLVSKTTLLFNILKFLDISKLPILLILPLELSIINGVSLVNTLVFVLDISDYSYFFR